MSAEIVLAALLLLGTPQSQASEQQNEPPPAPANNSCATCHLELGQDEIVEGVAGGAHNHVGLSCAGCHGGDPTVGFDGDFEASMDPARGFVGAPGHRDIVRFCARCHSDADFIHRYNPRLPVDQLAQYETSHHGQQLKLGNTRVAVCTDCHGVHGILKASDSRSPVHALNVAQTCGHCHSDPERMADSGLPTDQQTLWAASVHGEAMSSGDEGAATCNDCHGNHGATPPGAPSVAYVCGQCHLSNAELFLASPHRDAYREAGFPECETCHSNHDVERPTEALLAPGDVNICAVCHLEDTPGRLAAQTMYENIEALKSSIGGAREVLTSAEEAGMPVNEPLFLLSEADDSLVHVRTAVHSLSIERVHEVSDEGQQKAGEALQAGLDALDELQFRRRGLFLSLIFIAALAIGLYMKIREADRRWKAAENGSEAGSGHP